MNSCLKCISPPLESGVFLRGIHHNLHHFKHVLYLAPSVVPLDFVKVFALHRFEEVLAGILIHLAFAVALIEKLEEVIADSFLQSVTALVITGVEIRWEMLAVSFLITRNGGGAILRFSAGITSGIEYCSASSSLIFLILLLETDFMKGHSAFWAVAHEDGFQRGHLHVLIYLVHLDTASPRIEIAGDVPLVPVDRKAVEELVELVP